YTLYLLYVFVLSSCPFFFNDTSTTAIYTLSLHDALPIYIDVVQRPGPAPGLGHPDRDLVHFFCCLLSAVVRSFDRHHHIMRVRRSEEHTSELQSRFDLVCRLLLEKKNQQ